MGWARRNFIETGARWLQQSKWHSTRWVCVLCVVRKIIFAAGMKNEKKKHDNGECRCLFHQKQKTGAKILAYKIYPQASQNGIGGELGRNYRRLPLATGGKIYSQSTEWKIMGNRVKSAIGLQVTQRVNVVAFGGPGLEALVLCCAFLEREKNKTCDGVTIN